MKKTISFLLTLIMVMSVFSSTIIMTQAASPIKTQNEAVSWLNTQQDKTYNFDGAYGTQCTEFVKAYVNYVMTGDPWKNCGYEVYYNGRDVWKSSFWANNGWTVHKNTFDFMPQPGDIFCAGLSAYGHTGVVISSDIYTAKIAEANGRDTIVDNGDPVWIRTINWRSSTTDSPYGATYFIRPKFSSTPVASLVTPTITLNKSSYVMGDTITVSWIPSPSNSNLSHYWINVRNPAGNLIINEKIDKSKTSYSFTAPGVGTYGVTIFATPYGSASGEGSLTDTKYVTINRAVTVPETPKVTATNTLSGISVKWNAVPGAVKYVVYKRLGTSSTWNIIATTTGTSFSDNNASAYGSYYVYSVKAYNAANVPSDYVRANTATVQRVVAPYTKASNALDGINVTWGKVAGANKYVVLRRIGTESTWKILGETTGTSFVDKNVRAGVYYLYSIRAVNNTGYSAYDVNKRFTIQRVVAPYTKASNAVNGINVTWGKVAGASKYVVLRRIGTESTWKIIGETTGVSFLDKNVTPGIYYIYSIRAVNGTGYSAYDINKRITIQYITAPTARAVNKAAGVQVSWNSVSGATKYNVYRRVGGSSTWIYMGTTTGTSVLDISVVDGKYYVYSIRAINGTGYSAYNSSKCATIKHI